MKLEAGKRYVRRDGTTTPPLEQTDLFATEGYLYDQESHLFYDPLTDDGHLVFPISMRQDPRDLVAPYESHGEAR